MTESTAYSYRPRPTGPGLAFRLDPDGLHVTSGRGAERVPYEEIAAIRLAATPSNWSPHVYLAKLQLGDGRSLKLSNLSWQGLVAAERLDAPYVTFITELLRRTHQANPALVCRAGTPRLFWMLSIAIGAALVVAFLSLMAVAVRQGGWTAALLVGMLAIPMAWVVRAHVWSNRPRNFTPDAPPGDVLPPGAR